MNESFERITSRELTSWKLGNYDESLNESDGTQDPCEGCGKMYESEKLTNRDGEYLCEMCGSK